MKNFNQIHIYNTINQVLTRYSFAITAEEVVTQWNAPHRFYHTAENHLGVLIDDILAIEYMDNQTKDELILVAIFHDWIYDSKSTSNESDSVIAMNKLYQGTDPDLMMRLNTAILATINHTDYPSKLAELFGDLDMNILNGSFADLLAYEALIQQEYEWVNWETYKTNRLAFLKQHASIHNQLRQLMVYLEAYTPKIGIYVGSFNPFHLGHQNVVTKGEKCFDKIILGKGRNDKKVIDEAEFARELANLRALYPTKEVVTYSGLLSDFLKTQSGNITVIRGLRNGYDLEAENTFMQYVRDEFPALQVVYISCDPALQHISSTGIRVMRDHGCDISKYLPHGPRV